MEFRDKLCGAGCPGILAGTIARAIAGTSTSAETFAAKGLSGPLAIELAKQISTATYNVNNLVALGMSPVLASVIRVGS